MEASWYLLLERFPDDAERNRVEFNTYIIYIYIYINVYIYIDYMPDVYCTVAFTRLPKPFDSWWINKV